MHANHKNAACMAAAPDPLLLLRNSAIDDLSAALRKAQALSFMTYGEGGDSLRGMQDGYQDYFMWALAGLLTEAVGALDRLTGLEAIGRQGGAA